MRKTQATGEVLDFLTALYEEVLGNNPSLNEVTAIIFQTTTTGPNGGLLVLGTDGNTYSVASRITSAYEKSIKLAYSTVIFTMSRNKETWLYSVDGSAAANAGLKNEERWKLAQGAIATSNNTQELDW